MEDKYLNWLHRELNASYQYQAEKILDVLRVVITLSSLILCGLLPLCLHTSLLPPSRILLAVCGCLLGLSLILALCSLTVVAKWIRDRHVELIRMYVEYRRRSIVTDPATGGSIKTLLLFQWLCLICFFLALLLVLAILHIELLSK